MAETAPGICIYHAPCQDGFTAAYAVWARFGDAQTVYHPSAHGDPPPDVTGKHVVIVDFSYPPAVLEKMAEVAASMMVLDHHKSAIEALANIPVAQSTWEGHLSASALEQEKPDGAPIAAVFDMERSGAVIAWQYFHPNIVVPWLFRYVQDRDLWRFALPYTREISAALFSYDYDFNTWSSLHLRLETDNSYSRLLTEGKGIERKHHKDIRELLDATRREMTIGGHVVPVANMPYTMASDAANIMAEGQPFAATYYETSSGRLAFSLRSAEDGADVSEIAKMYGGGGHKHAAGFSVPAGTILLPQTP